MQFRPDERVAVFIDGTSLYSAARSLGFEVDYRKMRVFFLNQCNLRRIYYYAAILENEQYSPLKPLTDWLAYNSYTLVTKPAKEFTDSSGRRRIKANMEVEIAVDMLELADHMDHMVLFSGDADFRRLIEAVQRKGVFVTIVSSLKTAPPQIADELRRQADAFVELQDIAVEFTRDPKERPDRSHLRPMAPPPPEEAPDIDLPPALIGTAGEAEVIDDRRTPRFTPVRRRIS